MRKIMSMKYKDRGAISGELGPSGLETLVPVSPEANPLLSLQQLDFVSQHFPSFA